MLLTRIEFEFGIGVKYFEEIARLRAFQLLWYNLLEAWSQPLVRPNISVVFKPEAYSDDLFTNMIRATTMAMSGVLGGATRLTVLPYDSGREEDAPIRKRFRDELPGMFSICFDWKE